MVLSLLLLDNEERRQYYCVSMSKVQTNDEVITLTALQPLHSVVNVTGRVNHKIHNHHHHVNNCIECVLLAYICYPSDHISPSEHRSE
jgi:hypothetical protein